MFLVLTKTRVVVCASTSSLMRSMLWSSISLTGVEENLAVGSRISMSISRAPEILAIETLCGFMSLSRGSLATRNSATASSGSIVALMPILWTCEGTTTSMRARESERWVPRLVGTRACISSIIIHRRSSRIGLNLFDASAKPNDSGVVMRM